MVRRDGDCFNWVSGGLWPEFVVGPLDAEVGHLAFDDAGVGAPTAGGEEVADYLLQPSARAAARWSGGKGRLRGDLASSEAEGAGEGEPVGVRTGVLGGGVHELADRVVDELVAPDLLLHAFGRAGTKDLGGAALVGLQLVQRGLDLPSLVVAGRQLCCGCGLVVEDDGDQPVRDGVLRAAGVVQGVRPADGQSKGPLERRDDGSPSGRTGWHNGGGRGDAVQL